VTPLAVAGLRQSSAPSGRVVGTAPTNPQETLQPQSCTEIANRLYLGEVSDHTPKPTVLLLCTIQHASGAADLRSMLLVEATTAPVLLLVQHLSLVAAIAAATGGIAC